MSLSPSTMELFTNFVQPWVESSLNLGTIYYDEGDQPQRDEGMEVTWQVQEGRMVLSEGQGDPLYGSGMGGYKEWDEGPPRQTCVQCGPYRSVSSGAWAEPV